MNRCTLPLTISLLLLAVGWGCTYDPMGPTEAPFCSSLPASAVATFEDAKLEEAVRAAISVGAQEDLTCSLVSELTALLAFEAGITSLMGIQNLPSLMTLDLTRNSIRDISALTGLTNLTGLDLTFNSITDISALSGLTSLMALFLGANSITDVSSLGGLTTLTFLDLAFNSISDIRALSGLTSLRGLSLGANSVTDISALNELTSLTDLFLFNNSALTNIQPLLDNPGLGAGDRVDLQSTSVSCLDVAALRAKGVVVVSDCS